MIAEDTFEKEVVKMYRVALFSPNGSMGRYMYENLKKEKNLDLSGITRETDLTNLNKEYDLLIYTAAIISARRETPQKYVTDNILSCIHMVDFCERCKIKRIIYISTDEIYGSLNTDEVDENSPMISPNIYATSKYMAERIIIESGIPYFILRLPGVVGEQWGKGLLYRLFDDIRNNKKINIYNGNRDFNNFVYMPDLLRFILLLIYSKYEQSESFVLGNCEKMTLCKIIDYIKQLCGSDVSVYNIDDTNKRYFTLNVNKAVKFGYSSERIQNVLQEIGRIKKYE